MELIVLDKNFIAIDVIDEYESLIWTDRYNKYGDFEMYLPVNVKTLTNIKEDYYLTCKESEHTMIIETIQITSDKEKGNILKVTGRSLESILDRRVIFAPNNTDVLSFQTLILFLISEHFVNAMPQRIVSNLILRTIVNAALDVSVPAGQYFTKELYDVVSELCQMYGVGFKIILEDTNFVFSLYIGTDRSYSQTSNPFVVFSPNFDNVLDSNYIQSTSNLKTTALVLGALRLEDPDNGITNPNGNRESAMAWLTENGGQGIYRREIFTDAGDIKQTASVYSDSAVYEYNQLLVKRGKEVLSQNGLIRAFDGNIDSGSLFVYEEDFFMGDLVQIGNSYGQESRSRVIEMIISEDITGHKIYPTLSTE